MCSLHVLLLLGQTPPPPPPPPVHPPPHPAPAVPCIYSPPDHPEIVYNMTSLEKHFAADPIDLMVRGPMNASTSNASNASATFYVSVCNPSHNRCSHTKCATCSPTIVPAGIMHWSATSGDTCGALGEFGTAKWALQDPLKPAGGVQISYVAGDGGRSVTLQHMCDPVLGIEGMPVAKAWTATPDKARKNHYTVTIYSAAACPIMPRPLSWGWLTLIFGSLLVSLYVGVGIGYNRRQGYEGAEAMPSQANLYNWAARLLSSDETCF